MSETVIDLYEPESGVLNVRYQPNEDTEIPENPPRFTWMPAKLENDVYILELSSDAQFAREHTLTYKPIQNNLFTPGQSLDSGMYYWRYALVSDDDRHTRISSWSRVRRFKVEGDLPTTPLPGRAERYADVRLTRPRLWLTEPELIDFRKRVGADQKFCHWEAFYEHSVKPFLQLPMTIEPEPYPRHQRVADRWRQMYIDCQEALYAIRHLSVAGVILEDKEIIAKAKEWLFHVSGWDPAGTTSRDYNDEAAFRVAAALAWGYDWLHDYLSAEERALVKERLLIRAKQVAFHVIERSKIHQVPYDSHAVRSLSSVLVPAGIALFEELPEAREWLDYTLEYYSGMYTPWGGADGGWAEGPHYWMTGMACVTEAMNLMKKI